MNIHKHKKTRSGFTLIELLTVIAIIGILAGILIPAVGLVRTAANKASSVSNMRSIATAFSTWSTPNNRVKILTAAMLPSADTNGVAEFLAENAGLVESDMWLIPSADAYADYVAAGNDIPPLIGTRGAGNVWATSGDWVAGVPVEYNFAIAIPASRSTSLTPLLWTNGLRPGDGAWDPGATPWETGGHICYLDAHVTYYEALDVASPNGEYLVNPTDGTLTVAMTDVHPNPNVMEPAVPTP